MSYSLILVVATLGLTAAAQLPDFHPFSDELIDYINSLNTTWKAKRFFHKDAPLSNLYRLLGAIPGPPPLDIPIKQYPAEVIASLPDNFDSRYNWPYCTSLNEIRDQGGCGSCWAVSSASVMTDRYCIHNMGKEFHFSSEDVLTCCPECGSGCKGGSHAKALQHWATYGFVSGGPYGSQAGCKPYTIAPCDHTGADPSRKCVNHDTPACQRTCQPSYRVQYKQDLKRGGSNVYRVKGEAQMMAELVSKGPIVAKIGIAADFGAYSSGVYHRLTPFLPGQFHDVKIIGYGVEAGTKYWLVANSWNTAWGDAGYIKILRGNNECGIEQEVYAADAGAY